MALLAESGGDTVKLFDVSVEPGDPCTLSYTPTPGCLVNAVKWNHTSESFTHSLFSLFSFTS
jgi:protein NEDD1